MRLTRRGLLRRAVAVPLAGVAGFAAFTAMDSSPKILPLYHYLHGRPDRLTATEVDCLERFLAPKRIRWEGEITRRLP